MKTLRLTIDPENPRSAASRVAIDTAASILRQGGLVAFPTETVYGLGANAFDAEAVEKIFIAKCRPAWDPLIVHISDEAMLSQLLAAGPPGRAALTQSATRLMNAFWPGPLTLLLPKSDRVPSIVTAGRPLVGVRMPEHPVARALIAAAGVPIAAPSANRFGRVSPTRASHVLEDLNDRIDAVLDAGDTTHGVESTVVDASQERVIFYRPGIISFQQIREICGAAVEWRTPEPNAAETQTLPESLPSPGLGIRHYAPLAHLELVDGVSADQPAAFLGAVQNALDTSGDTRSIGVMLPGGFLSAGLTPSHEKIVIFNWGNWSDSTMLARRLFAGLRQLDAAGVEVILCPLPSSDGTGTAIRDRLLKAARSS